MTVTAESDREEEAWGSMQRAVWRKSLRLRKKPEKKPINGAFVIELNH